MCSWKDNVFRLLRTGESGKCPYCGSEDTSYVLKIVNKETNMGYGTIWCNRCKAAFHISRTVVKQNMETPKMKVPSNLIYKDLYQETSE